MKIQQERLQYTVSDESHEHDAHSWASDESARTQKGNPESVNGQNTNVFLNSLPPGMDHSDQQFADIRQQELSRGNLGHGDQFTTDVTERSLRQGWDRKQLSLTDDQHGDAGFYDEVTIEGKTGFLERRNVADRN
jgi:hypothetical protein